MTQALRSPGSTLKPFIYGLGFEDGLIHPETLIEDRPVRYGSYAPENFDLTFQGTVTVRRRCRCRSTCRRWRCSTRSAPAASPRASRRRAARWCCRRARRRASRWGSAASACRLTDLVMLYAGARAARHHGAADRACRDWQASAAAPRRLIDPVAAWYVGNVLLGTPPPENAAGGRIAFKTGTSYGYRDAWSVGFDGKRTIGVWVGRPDGAPVPGLVGRAAAAPILFDAFARTGKLPAALPPRAQGRADRAPTPSCRRRCSASGPAACRARAPSRRCASCSRRTARGSNSRAARTASPSRSRSRSRAAPGALTVLVNGVPLPAAAGRRTLFFEPEGPGFRAAHRDGRARARPTASMVRLQ